MTTVLPSKNPKPDAFIASVQQTLSHIPPGLWLICLLFVLHAFYFNILTDDGFIAFRYAQNFASGHGLVFNIGERVEGYTSPLWVIILGVAGALGGNIPGIAQGLGIIAGLMCLIATYNIGCMLGLRYPLVATALLAASGSFAFWATGGLEAPLFTALITWATWFTLKQRFYSGTLLWSLVYLCRPEGLLFVGITGLYLLISAYRRQIQWRVPLIFGSTILVVVSVHVLWRLSYYGYPLPNTFYAKVGSDFAAQFARGLRYTGWFVLIYGVGFIGILFFRKLTSTILYLVALALTSILYVFIVGGDGLMNWRFLLPLLPFGYLLATLGYDRIFSRKSGRFYAIAALALSIMTVIPGLQNIYFLLNGGTNQENIDLVRQRYEHWQAAGEWLRDNVPQDTIIAVTAVGYIPYYSGLTTIDMLGLNDEHIAHLDIGIGRGTAGHEKWQSAYILERMPDIYVLTFLAISDILPDWDAIFASVEFATVDADTDLLSQPEFQSLYESVSILLDDGRYINFFRLRDTS